MFQSIRFDLANPGQYLQELSRLSDSDWRLFIEVMRTACVIEKESAKAMEDHLIRSRSALDDDRHGELLSLLRRPAAILASTLSCPEMILANTLLSQLIRHARSAYPRCGKEVEAMLGDALSGVTYVMMLDPYFFSGRQRLGRDAFINLLARKNVQVLDVYYGRQPESKGQKAGVRPELQGDWLDTDEKVTTYWRKVLDSHGITNLKCSFRSIDRLTYSEDPNPKNGGAAGYDEHDRFIVLRHAELGDEHSYIVALGRGVMSFVESEARTTVALLPKCWDQLVDNRRWKKHTPENAN